MHRARPIARVCLFATVLLLAFAGRAAADEAASAPGSESELFELLFGEAPPAESPDDILLVEAIRVERPQSFTDEYIRSFNKELKVGRRYARAELEKRIAAIDERLRLSGMFYSSLASYRAVGSVEGTDVAQRVDVLLAVSEGFHWGFNFYPWDLSVSYANFAEAGKAAALKLGLNSQELLWADPSISDGPFYYMASAAHSMRLRGGGVDPAYLAQVLRAEAEFGMRPTDELRVGLGAGYLGLDSPESYFLFPSYRSPGESALAGLGLSRSYGDYLQVSGRAAIFEYGYKRRGGLRGRLVSAARVYFPLRGGAALTDLSAEGKLRYDAPAIFSLIASERIEAYPWAGSSADIPDPLRAALDEFRCASGLLTGEFASQSRLSLDFGLGKPIGMGFTSLSIVPELYYELAFVGRSSYSSRMAGQQGCGLVVQFAFAQPVNRTFALGIGLGLPGLPDFFRADAAREDLAAKFVFEIY